MGKFLKNMKSKLIMSSFLCIASASAMDSPPKECVHALDLEVRKLLETNNLDMEEDCIKNGQIGRFPNNGGWLLSTDGYNRGGYLFDSQEEAIEFRESLREKDKEMEQKKQEKIKEIFAKKAALIDALSAKDQFELAQEYQQLNQATPYAALPDGYSLALEKSAEKGFLPAVKELIKNYTNRHSQESEAFSKALSYPMFVHEKEEISLKLTNYKKEIDFYQEIQVVLTNETLGIVEQADALKKAFESKKDTAKK